MTSQLLCVESVCLCFQYISNVCEASRANNPYIPTHTSIQDCHLHFLYNCFIPHLIKTLLLAQSSLLGNIHLGMHCACAYSII